MHKYSTATIRHFHENRLHLLRITPGRLSQRPTLPAGDRRPMMTGILSAVVFNMVPWIFFPESQKPVTPARPSPLPRKTRAGFLALNRLAPDLPRHGIFIA